MLTMDDGITMCNRDWHVYTGQRINTIYTFQTGVHVLSHLSFELHTTDLSIVRGELTRPPPAPLMVWLPLASRLLNAEG